MNAKRLPSQDQKQAASTGSLKGALIKSSLFHALIFIVALVGIPFAAKEPLIITPVSVELVDIDDVTRTKVKAPPQKELEKPKEIEAPKPPKIEKPKPPQPKPEPEPVKEAPPEPKKEPEKPKEQPKPKPKPPEPKKEEPKKQDFESLLKDLTPDEPDEPKQETPVPEEKGETSGELADLADRLSMSELDAFKRQIEPCWNVPSGAKYAENLSVEIRVNMNRDMTVRDARVLDQGRYNRDSAYRAAADSALRALRNPRCSPLKLPPEKYNEWKVIVINFDPRNML